MTLPGLLDLFRAPGPGRASRPPYDLPVDGLGVEVRRKPMRTLRLSLGPGGRIRVSAPLRASDESIAAFVRKHRGWIETRRRRVLDEESKPRPDYRDGDAVPLWGGLLRLQVRAQGKVGRAVLVPPGVLELRLPEGSTRARRESLLRRWLSRELLAAADARLPALQAAMGVGACALRVRFMSSRWGSCNARTGLVTLAVQLAQKPPEFLDYVLIHELAHFKVRSHGARFRALMDKHLPDWRERRKRLNAGSASGAAWGE